MMATTVAFGESRVKPAASFGWSVAYAIPLALLAVMVIPTLAHALPVIATPDGLRAAVFDPSADTFLNAHWSVIGAAVVGLLMLKPTPTRTWRSEKDGREWSIFGPVDPDPARGLLPETEPTAGVSTARQYAGKETAKETNLLFKQQIEHLGPAISAAFSQDYAAGINPDHPLALYFIGTAGISVSTWRDIADLLDGIPLDKVSTNYTINLPSAMTLLAHLLVAKQQARERGIDERQMLSKVRVTLQNDPLKEFEARHTETEEDMPLDLALRYWSDQILYVIEQGLSGVRATSLAGYHIREAGSTASGELAMVFSNAVQYITYLKRLTREHRGKELSIEQIAPVLSFFMNLKMDTFEEPAKLRAARVIWADLMLEFLLQEYAQVHTLDLAAMLPQERAALKDGLLERLATERAQQKQQAGANKSFEELKGDELKALSRILQWRVMAYTGGTDSTAQQPHHNIARVALKGQHGTWGGAAGRNTISLDEALTIPTPWTREVGGDTTLFLSLETDEGEFVDLFGGSPVIEGHTRRIVDETWQRMGRLATESDYQGVIRRIKEDARAEAYREQVALETGRKRQAGVNLATAGAALYEADRVRPPIRRMGGEAVSAAQQVALGELLATRDHARVRAALVKLCEAIRDNGQNFMPAEDEAVAADATVEEIHTAMRQAHTTDRPIDDIVDEVMLIWQGERIEWKTKTRERLARLHGHVERTKTSSPQHGFLALEEEAMVASAPVEVFSKPFRAFLTAQGDAAQRRLAATPPEAASDVPFPAQATSDPLGVAADTLTQAVLQDQTKPVTAESLQTLMRSGARVTVNGYALRQAGATPIQEIAYTLEHVRRYLDAALAEGLGVAEAVERLDVQLSAGLRTVEEVAKLRALGRLWRELLKGRYHVNDEALAAFTLRIHIKTDASALTKGKIWNNNSRTAVQARNALLAQGAVGIHIVDVQMLPFDAPVGEPTDLSAIAQDMTEASFLVLRHEVGLTAAEAPGHEPFSMMRYADPLGGSYAVEAWTDHFVQLGETMLAALEQTALPEAQQLIRQLIHAAATEQAEHPRPRVGVTHATVDPNDPEAALKDPRPVPLREMITWLWSEDDTKRHQAAQQFALIGDQLIRAVARHPVIGRLIAPVGWDQEAQERFVTYASAGLALTSEHFDLMRPRWGNPPLSNVPPGVGVDECEIHVDLPETFPGEPTRRILDILRDTPDSPRRTIAHHIKRFGEGIQQVEVPTDDIWTAAKDMLEAAKDSASGVTIVDDAPREGANGTTVFFVLVTVSGGRKVLVELIQRPAQLLGSAEPQAQRPEPVHAEPVRTIVSERPLRMLLAKPGLDGHDRGLHVLGQAFRDAGLETIVMGLRLTPELIVQAAIQERADVIGISTLAGAQLGLVHDVIKGLDDAGMKGRIKVMVGGVLERERTRLLELGVDFVGDPTLGTGSLHQALEYLQSVATPSAAAKGTSHAGAQQTLGLRAWQAFQHLVVEHVVARDRQDRQRAEEQNEAFLRRVIVDERATRWPPRQPAQDGSSRPWSLRRFINLPRLILSVLMTTPPDQEPPIVPVREADGRISIRPADQPFAKEEDDIALAQRVEAAVEEAEGRPHLRMEERFRLIQWTVHDHELQRALEDVAASATFETPELARREALARVTLQYRLTAPLIRIVRLALALDYPTTEDRVRAFLTEQAATPGIGQLLEQLQRDPLALAARYTDPVLRLVSDHFVEQVFPGSNRRNAERAAASVSPVVILDLEDAVKAEDKVAARAMLVANVRELNWQGKHVFVRLNNFETRWSAGDVLEVIGEIGGQIAGIVLPKVHGPDDIRLADQLLTALEQAHGWEAGRLKIQPLIELPEAVLQVDEIIAASPRVAGLIFGLADYVAATRGKHAAMVDQFIAPLWAKRTVVEAARRAGIDVIDGLTRDVRDARQTAIDAVFSAAIGFTGKWSLHPAQTLAILDPRSALRPEDWQTIRATLEALQASISDPLPTIEELQTRLAAARLWPPAHISRHTAHVTAEPYDLEVLKAAARSERPLVPPKSVAVRSIAVRRSTLEVSPIDTLAVDAAIASEADRLLLTVVDDALPGAAHRSEWEAGLARLAASGPSTRATASGRGLAQDSAPRAQEEVPRALPVGLHKPIAIQESTAPLPNGIVSIVLDVREIDTLPDRLATIDQLLARYEQEQGVAPQSVEVELRIVSRGVITESPARLYRIVRAASRVACLIYADSSAPDDVMAKGALLAIAASIDADAVDYEGGHQAAEPIAVMGFSGRLTADPGQTGVLNTAFTPTPEEIARAQAIAIHWYTKGVDIYQETDGSGTLVDEAIAKVEMRRLRLAAMLDRLTPNQRVAYRGIELFILVGLAAAGADVPWPARLGAAQALEEAGRWAVERGWIRGVSRENHRLTVTRQDGTTVFVVATSASPSGPRGPGSPGGATPPPIPPEQSQVRTYLRTAKQQAMALKHLQGDKPIVNIVMGNEASDLDSIISSIAYAYAKSQASLTERERTTLFLPLMNIPQEDFRLRTEAVYWLAQLGISEDDLLFTDMLDISTLQQHGYEVHLTLVDHNNLAEGQQYLWPLVTEIIDHHADDKRYRDQVSVEIASVGSNTTLIAERILRTDLLNRSPELAQLLLGPILLDTINLDEKVGRVTDRDRRVAEALLAVTNRDRETIFRVLQVAKFDLSGLRVDDILRKDPKSYREGRVSYCISSITGFPLTGLLERTDDFTSVLERLLQQRGWNMIVGMMSYEDRGTFRRELFIYSDDVGRLQKLVMFLQGIPALQLGEPSSAQQLPQNTRFVAFATSPGISRKLLAPYLKTFFDAEGPGSSSTGGAAPASGDLAEDPQRPRERRRSSDGTALENSDRQRQAHANGQRSGGGGGRQDPVARLDPDVWHELLQLGKSDALARGLAELLVEARLSDTRVLDRAEMEARVTALIERASREELNAPSFSTEERVLMVPRLMNLQAREAVVLTIHQVWALSLESRQALRAYDRGELDDRELAEALVADTRSASVPLDDDDARGIVEEFNDRRRQPRGAQAPTVIGVTPIAAKPPASSASIFLDDDVQRELASLGGIRSVGVTLTTMMLDDALFLGDPQAVSQRVRQRLLDELDQLGLPTSSEDRMTPDWVQMVVRRLIDLRWREEAIRNITTTESPTVRPILRRYDRGDLLKAAAIQQIAATYPRNAQIKPEAEAARLLEVFEVIRRAHKQRFGSGSAGGTPSGIPPRERHHHDLVASIALGEQTSIITHTRASGPAAIDRLGSSAFGGRPRDVAGKNGLGAPETPGAGAPQPPSAYGRLEGPLRRAVDHLLSALIGEYPHLAERVEALQERFAQAVLNAEAHGRAGDGLLKELADAARFNVAMLRAQWYVRQLAALGLAWRAGQRFATQLDEFQANLRSTQANAWQWLRAHEVLEEAIFSTEQPLDAAVRQLRQDSIGNERTQALALAVLTSAKPAKPLGEMRERIDQALAREGVDELARREAATIVLDALLRAIAPEIAIARLRNVDIRSPLILDPIRVLLTSANPRGLAWADAQRAPAAGAAPATTWRDLQELAVRIGRLHVAHSTGVLLQGDGPIIIETKPMPSGEAGLDIDVDILTLPSVAPEEVVKNVLADPLVPADVRWACVEWAHAQAPHLLGFSGDAIVPVVSAWDRLAQRFGTVGQAVVQALVDRLQLGDQTLQGREFFAQLLLGEMVSIEEAVSRLQALKARDPFIEGYVKRRVRWTALSHRVMSLVGEFGPQTAREVRDILWDLTEDRMDHEDALELLQRRTGLSEGRAAQVVALANAFVEADAASVRRSGGRPRGRPSRGNEHHRTEVAEPGSGRLHTLVADLAAERADIAGAVLGGAEVAGMRGRRAPTGRRAVGGQGVSAPPAAVTSDSEPLKQLLALARQRFIRPVKSQAGLVAQPFARDYLALVATLIQHASSLDEGGLAVAHELLETFRASLALYRTMAEQRQDQASTIRIEILAALTQALDTLDILRRALPTRASDTPADRSRTAMAKARQQLEALEGALSHGLPIILEWYGFRPRGVGEPPIKTIRSLAARLARRPSSPEHASPQATGTPGGLAEARIVIHQLTDKHPLTWFTTTEFSDAWQRRFPGSRLTSKQASKLLLTLARRGELKKREIAPSSKFRQQGRLLFQVNKAVFDKLPPDLEFAPAITLERDAAHPPRLTKQGLERAVAKILTKFQHGLGDEGGWRQGPLRAFEDLDANRIELINLLYRWLKQPGRIPLPMRGFIRWMIGLREIEPQELQAALAEHPGAAKTELMRLLGATNPTAVHRALKRRQGEPREPRGFSGLTDALDRSPYRSAIRELLDRAARADSSSAEKQSVQGVRWNGRWFVSHAVESETFPGRFLRGAVNTTVEALNALPIPAHDLHALKGVTIFFIKGLDDAVRAYAIQNGLSPPEPTAQSPEPIYGSHYGIARKHIYLDARFLTAAPNPEPRAPNPDPLRAELLRHLHHEGQERHRVLSQLTETERATFHSQRPADLITKISRVTASAHAQLTEEEGLSRVVAKVSGQPLGEVERFVWSLKAEVIHQAFVRRFNLQSATYQARFDGGKSFQRAYQEDPQRAIELLGAGYTTTGHQVDRQGRLILDELPDTIPGELPQGLQGKMLYRRLVVAGHQVEIEWAWFPALSGWLPVAILGPRGAGKPTLVRTALDADGTVIAVGAKFPPARLRELTSQHGTCTIAGRVPPSGLITLGSLYQFSWSNRFDQIYLATVRPYGVVTQFRFLGFADVAEVIDLELAVKRDPEGTDLGVLGSHLEFSSSALADLYKSAGSFWLAGLQVVAASKERPEAGGILHIAIQRVAPTIPGSPPIVKRYYYVLPAAYVRQPAEVLIGDSGMPVYLSIQGRLGALKDYKRFLKRIEIRTTDGALQRVSDTSLHVATGELRAALLEAEPTTEQVVVTRLQVYGHRTRVVRIGRRQRMLIPAHLVKGLPDRLAAEVVYDPASSSPERPRPVRLRVGRYSSDNPDQFSQITFEIVREFGVESRPTRPNAFIAVELPDPGPAPTSTGAATTLPPLDPKKRFMRIGADDEQSDAQLLNHWLMSATGDEEGAGAGRGAQENNGDGAQMARHLSGQTVRDTEGNEFKIETHLLADRKEFASQYWNLRIQRGVLTAGQGGSDVIVRLASDSTALELWTHPEADPYRLIEETVKWIDEVLRKRPAPKPVGLNPVDQRRLLRERAMLARALQASGYLTEDQHPAYAYKEKDEPRALVVTERFAQERQPIEGLPGTYQLQIGNHAYWVTVDTQEETEYVKRIRRGGYVETFRRRSRTDGELQSVFTLGNYAPSAVTRRLLEAQNFTAEALLKFLDDLPKVEYGRFWSSVTEPVHAFLTACPACGERFRMAQASVRQQLDATGLRRESLQRYEGFMRSLELLTRLQPIVTALERDEAQVPRSMNYEPHEISDIFWARDSLSRVVKMLNQGLLLPSDLQRGGRVRSRLLEAREALVPVTGSWSYGYTAMEQPFRRTREALAELLATLDRLDGEPLPSAVIQFLGAIDFLGAAKAQWRRLDDPLNQLFWELRNLTRGILIEEKALLKQDVEHAVKRLSTIHHQLLRLQKQGDPYTKQELGRAPYYAGEALDALQRLLSELKGPTDDGSPHHTPDWSFLARLIERAEINARGTQWEPVVPSARRVLDNHPQMADLTHVGLRTYVRLYDAQGLAYTWLRWLAEDRHRQPPSTWLSSFKATAANIGRRALAHEWVEAEFEANPIDRAYLLAATRLKQGIPYSLEDLQHLMAHAVDDKSDDKRLEQWDVHLDPDQEEMALRLIRALPGDHPVRKLFNKPGVPEHGFAPQEIMWVHEAPEGAEEAFEELQRAYQQLQVAPRKTLEPLSADDPELLWLADRALWYVGMTEVRRVEAAALLAQAILDPGQSQLIDEAQRLARAARVSASEIHFIGDYMAVVAEAVQHRDAGRLIGRFGFEEQHRDRLSRIIERLAAESGKMQGEHKPMAPRDPQARFPRIGADDELSDAPFLNHLLMSASGDDKENAGAGRGAPEHNGDVSQNPEQGTVPNVTMAQREERMSWFRQVITRVVEATKGESRAVEAQGREPSLPMSRRTFLQLATAASAGLAIDASPVLSPIAQMLGETVQVPRAALSEMAIAYFTPARLDFLKSYPSVVTLLRWFADRDRPEELLEQSTFFLTHAFYMMAKDDPSFTGLPSTEVLRELRYFFDPEAEVDRQHLSGPQLEQALAHARATREANLRLYQQHPAPRQLVESAHTLPPGKTALPEEYLTLTIKGHFNAMASQIAELYEFSQTAEALYERLKHRGVRSQALSTLHQLLTKGPAFLEHSEWFQAHLAHWQADGSLPGELPSVVEEPASSASTGDPSGGLPDAPSSNKLDSVRQQAARLVRALTTALNGLQRAITVTERLLRDQTGIRGMETWATGRPELERWEAELPIHIQAAREALQPYRESAARSESKLWSPLEELESALEATEAYVRRFSVWRWDQGTTRTRPTLLRWIEELEALAAPPRHQVLMSLDDTRQPKPEEEAARRHLYTRQLEAFVAVADELPVLLQAAARALRDASVRDERQRVNELADDIRRFKEEAAIALELGDLELLTEFWKAVVRRAVVDASADPNEPLSLIDQLQELLAHLWRLRSIFDVTDAQASLEAIEALLAQVRDAATEHRDWPLVRSFSDLTDEQWIFYVTEGKFGRVERRPDGRLVLPIPNVRDPSPRAGIPDALAPEGIIPAEFRFKPDDVLVYPEVKAQQPDLFQSLERAVGIMTALERRGLLLDDQPYTMAAFRPHLGRWFAAGYLTPRNLQALEAGGFVADMARWIDRKDQAAIAKLFSGETDTELLDAINALGALEPSDLEKLNKGVTEPSQQFSREDLLILKAGYFYLTPAMRQKYLDAYRRWLTASSGRTGSGTPTEAEARAASLIERMRATPIKHLGGIGKTTHHMYPLKRTLAERIEAHGIPWDLARALARQLIGKFTFEELGDASIWEAIATQLQREQAELQRLGLAPHHLRNALPKLSPSQVARLKEELKALGAAAASKIFNRSLVAGDPLTMAKRLQVEEARRQWSRIETAINDPQAIEWVVKLMEDTEHPRTILVHEEVFHQTPGLAIVWQMALEEFRRRKGLATLADAAKASAVKLVIHVDHEPSGLYAASASGTKLILWDGVESVEAVPSMRRADASALARILLAYVHDQFPELRAFLYEHVDTTAQQIRELSLVLEGQEAMEALEAIKEHPAIRQRAEQKKAERIAALTSGIKDGSQGAVDVRALGFSWVTWGREGAQDGLLEARQLHRAPVVSWVGPVGWIDALQYAPSPAMVEQASAFEASLRAQHLSLEEELEQSRAFAKQIAAKETPVPVLAVIYEPVAEATRSIRSTGTLLPAIAQTLLNPSSSTVREGHLIPPNDVLDGQQLEVSDVEYPREDIDVKAAVMPKIQPIDQTMTGLVAEYQRGVKYH